jgi:hypothetical protein
VLFDPDTKAFLERGCSLVVGTVGPDGEPHAGRGWGLDVLEDGQVAVVRLLLDAADPLAIAHLAGGGAVAITAADVATLRSIQLKGVATGTEPLTSADVERGERYTEHFFADIHRTDGTPLELLERLCPVGYLPCTVEVRERYDQTPGPAAGERVGGPT